MDLDFISLKKNIKKNFSSFPTYKLALLGDSSTQLINQAIFGWGYEYKVNFKIYEADYNQIDSEIFTRSSELFKFDPDFIVILHSSQKLLSKFQDYKNKHSFADDYIIYVKELTQAIANNSSAKIIYSNYVELHDGIFGNYSNQLKQSFTYQIRKLNFELMNLSILQKNIFVNDISNLNNLVGFSRSHDAKLYVNSDIVFSLDFTTLISKNIIQIILSTLGRVKKCLILDLDNTIWGGIIGDDGIENIEIGDLGIGKAFTLMQKWIKQLKERGIILAVCSKNTESVAKEPFEKHPDMVLKLDDISVFVANWENKADNIRYIQKILNISFDSMIFLDDSVFERELVKRDLPEISVPELPDDPALYVSYLSSLNLFETSSFSIEDTERTKLYQEEAKRSFLKENFSSENDFLSSLVMNAEVKAFNDYNIPRVAQLTQRSNQFNLRTIRYTEDDIVRISESKDYKTLSFSLKDKYGDYGLIAAVILKFQKNNLFIDTWVMSCRVLKRGMEQFILNQIHQLCKDLGINSIIGEYRATEKNKIVENLFFELGFELRDDFWVLEIHKFEKFKTFIDAKY